MIELLASLRLDCLTLAEHYADGPDKTKWERYAAIIQTVIVQMQSNN